MKKTCIILSVMVSGLFACNQQKPEDAEASAEPVEITPPASPQTYAELSIKEGGQWNERVYEGGEFKNVDALNVPEQHTDHSYFIRYEGPGWESEKVGYRLYLDWRNAIDIFGKVNDSLVLSGVGQDNFDSYHEMSDWGMDILKVGSSLGIGSVGRLVDGKVMHFKNVDSTQASVANEADHSSVIINYYGWETGGTKIDLASNLSIQPGERQTKHSFQTSEAVGGICTGIVKFEEIPMIQSEDHGQTWAYVATFGKQTLVPDKLGMAIFYQTNNVEELIDGEFDHLLKFKPTTEPVTYYLLGAWEKEEDGIKTQKEFLNYLNEILNELNNQSQS